MAMHEVTQLHEYENLLRGDAAELSALCGDLLIGVTSFFRDADAFQSFATVLAAQFAERTRARIWVPGCASGEEAYSIAILLHEECPAVDARVFATDVDGVALERARAAQYADLEGVVTPDRLARYFRSSGGTFEVARFLRDRIVFGSHDLFADPPLTRIDAVSCRNVLIYLDPESQQRVLRMFHYALAAGGLLFLGSVESIGARDDLFETVDARARIYRRRDRPAQLPSLRWCSRPPDPLGLDVVATRMLAERFAPPSIIVDNDGHIVSVHGALDPFLVETSARLDLDALAHGLADVARAALAKSIASDGDIVIPGVITVDDRAIDLRVFAARQPHLHGLHVIVFERACSVHECSAHGELGSIMHDLHTTNEVLVTARDEIVVLNEELRIVSDELRRKSRESLRAADDLVNVLGLVGAGAIILDRALRIVRFTERAKRLWNLGDEDRDRAIADLVGTDITRRIAAVLDTLQSCDLDVATASGTHRLRIAPYRTADHSIEGLVLVVGECREEDSQ